MNSRLRGALEASKLDDVFHELTAILSIAGCFEQKTIFSELESATWPVSDPPHTPTHLDTSQDVIQVKGLEEWPDLQIDLVQSAFEVQRTRKRWLLWRLRLHQGYLPECNAIPQGEEYPRQAWN